jgi:sialate O-acetylesterase
MRMLVEVEVKTQMSVQEAGTLNPATSKLAFQATAWSLSNTLGDHMVLQRAPQKAVVWGFGNPGSTVKTTFNGISYQATVGSDTTWRQQLPATAAGGPYTITFTASTGESGSLNDVLFGDVFLCSGQSK